MKGQKKRQQKKQVINCFPLYKIDYRCLIRLSKTKMDRLMRAEQLVCALEKELLASQLRQDYHSALNTYYEISFAIIKRDIEKNQLFLRVRFTFALFIFYIIFCY